MFFEKRGGKRAGSSSDEEQIWRKVYKTTDESQIESCIHAVERVQSSRLPKKKST